MIGRTALRLWAFGLTAAGFSLVAGCSSSEFTGSQGHNSANLTSSTESLGQNATAATPLSGTGSGTTSAGSIATSQTDSQPTIGTGSGTTAATGSGIGTGSGSGSFTVVSVPGAVDPASDPSTQPSTSLNATQQAQAHAGIQRCLAFWGPAAPFDTNSTYRFLLATISVLGLGNPLYDPTPTSAPELVVVFANIDLATQVTWQLLNPNGYYCILGALNGLTDLTINLKQNAHLAGSALSLDVLSTTNNPGAVSLNILSDVKVVNVP